MVASQLDCPIVVRAGSLLSTAGKKKATRGSGSFGQPSVRRAQGGARGEGKHRAHEGCIDLTPGREEGPALDAPGQKNI